MNYIILLLGFVLLIKGADIFVDGASVIAKKLGIPAVIVGLTIVSLGTSAPELAVSLISSLNGSNEIAIGNVIGSNIFNTLMVLGTTAIILPLIIKKETVKNDFLVNTSVTILLFLFTFDSLFMSDTNIISRLDGLILILICIFYVVVLIKKAKKMPNEDLNEDTTELKNSLVDNNIEVNILHKVIFMIIGVAGIVVGGNLVVDSATNIAYSLGMSEKLVGLTIVAAGTSLPELVTSIVAALKGENDIALGNVLGSNIFNILLILGLSSLISPIHVSQALMTDFIYLIVINLLLIGLVFFNKAKEKKLTRIEGFLLVGLYLSYMAYIIIRN
ncbi:sodium:calcium antiporter [Clostridium botulinum]|uniref:calcium/sodium antiporter n=1 Tax=Clostridium botulinum TaxID=1491 RepID=UPI000174EB9C|nr:calcium/sodium antiporter [Clostridium botulinum]ACD51221.1 K+-dependent Na+/Ca+ exchanger protein [Clostridium botulinum E3 str. Alaska E43]AJF29028.1 sodium:proton exchanger [Clostridium botulinum]AJF32089.1 sodium:proton exchanger [Clostridium botulinum]MBN1073646.1 sodium:calcium antiporter [Clostridium botulinum]MBN1077021.1 sodium:calcium antiporter [Clostridium botulinum]